MGIPGLWDILRSAGKSRSLTHLTVVDGFEDNSSGKRAYRVGIDASIWFFHATGGQGGENPELRTLYFRCCRLLALPILPIFVFDGPMRPSEKRGKRIGKSEHWMVSGMREIIDAFGFEWWTAPGEAEAELAYLNDIGIIDAILSDDVDNFLFGAKVVIRNPSATLTGTQTHARKTGQTEKDDGQHVIIYRACDIAAHPDIGLKRGGLILIGLMSGGDYNTSGLTGFGPNIAHALAKCGYGDQLVDQLEQLKDTEDLVPIFLEGWRDAVRRDLCGPSKVTDLLKKKQPSKAKAITDQFPVVKDICNYAAPITSFTEGRDVSVIQWGKKPNLAKIAGICERHFEWGIKDIIIKRFRTTVWQGAVLRVLLEAVLQQDKKAAAADPLATPRKNTSHSSRHAPNTPGTRLAHAFLKLDVTSPVRPKPTRNPTSQECSSAHPDRPSQPSQTIGDVSLDKLILRIHSSRTHPSTDGLLEYRLEIDPSQLVAQAEAGVYGFRQERDTIRDGDFSDPGSDDGGPKKAKKAPPDPHSALRVWMPATIVKRACPEVVEEFDAVEKMKLAKKAGKGSKKGGAPAVTKTTGLITDWVQSANENEVVDALQLSRTNSASTESSSSSQVEPPARLLFPVSKPSLKPAASKPRSATAPTSTLYDVPDPFLDNRPSAPGDADSNIPSAVRPFSDPFAYLAETSNPKPRPKPKPKSSSKASPTSKRPVSVGPSDSDDRSRLPHVPRKTKAQLSPRKVARASESSDDELPARPDSPVDKHPRGRVLSSRDANSAKASAVEVIVLSSDDDTPQAVRKAPSTLKPSKPKKKIAVAQRGPAKKATPLDFFDIDVIDLT